MRRDLIDTISMEEAQRGRHGLETKPQFPSFILMVDEKNSALYDQKDELL